MNIKFESALERDMDLLIMEEFVSEPDFAEIFTSAAEINEE